MKNDYKSTFHSQIFNVEKDVTHSLQMFLFSRLNLQKTLTLDEEA